MRTEMRYAAMCGDEDSVARLLRQGADADTVNFGLSFSAKFGHDN